MKNRTIQNWVMASVLTASFSCFAKTFDVDRFEGYDKEIAVLVDTQGNQYDVPREILPMNTREGDVIEIKRDLKKREALERKAREIRNRLKPAPEGDIIIK